MQVHMAGDCTNYNVSGEVFEVHAPQRKPLWGGGDACESLEVRHHDVSITSQ